ncbi:MAG: hypothetical protein V1646_03090 [bacterium]
MNKINILILSFLTISYFQTNAMTIFSSKELSAEQKDTVRRVVDSFKQANKIKNIFLRLKNFDVSMCENDKISQITDLLRSYQEAHQAFVYAKHSCNPQILSFKYLHEYCFCDFLTQDKFQAKTDALLGGYVLDLHQWLEEMRSMEYESLLIPYRLING